MKNKLESLCYACFLLLLPPAAAQPPSEKIWSGLQQVKWDSTYHPDASTCKAVSPHTSLRGGLYGHAFYCIDRTAEVLAETFYYPVGVTQPVVLLRRADFRLANSDPETSAEVERLLTERLTRAYGPGTVPKNLFEIGVTPPHPGRSWQAGRIAIFLHHNRNYAAGAGVREGVLLIAIDRAVIRERELNLQLQEAFGNSTKLSHSVIAADLRKEFGEDYPTKGEADTSAALLRLLARTTQGDRAQRAAVLVAADDLTVRLGSLLIRRSIAGGSETLSEAPDADRVRRQLAPYGVRYSGIGHYSGDLEYDRSLLRRAWKRYPETQWGQRAFLLLQRLGNSIPGFGCDGPNCFQAVIRQGEQFLREYPDTPFRREQIYHLALAYETWWSLSQAEPGDPTAEGARIDKREAERARKKAIELYEELFRIAPDSPEARAGRLVLPRLKLRLATGERTFFFFTD